MPEMTRAETSRDSKSTTTAARPGRPADAPTLHPGLAGIHLAETRTSRVEGEVGRLTVAGFDIETLAARAPFEEVAWRLLADSRGLDRSRPTADDLATFRAALARRRGLALITIEVLRRAAAEGRTPMTALRAAASTLGPGLAPAGSESLPGWQDRPEQWQEALSLLAKIPSMVAAFDRLRRGLEPIDPGQDLDAELGHAAAFLYRLDGERPSAARVRALDAYLDTVSDHGCNASTFTARVVVSTGADLVSAVVGALGALSGPLHGGAPGPALDLVFEIGRPERAEAVLRAKLDAGERLMGFGHRVYRARDPRAAVLADAAAALYQAGESRASQEVEGDLYTLFRAVESTAIRLLDERKPERRLRANVELYTALLLHGLGLPNDLFTPVFAMARTAGWLAHCREQITDGRLIRPRLWYVGEEGPVSEAAAPETLAPEAAAPGQPS